MKKTITRKCLSILLAVTVVFTGIPITAGAAIERGDTTSDATLSVKDIVRYKRVLSSVDGAVFSQNSVIDTSGDYQLNAFDIDVLRWMLVDEQVEDIRLDYAPTFVGMSDGTASGAKLTWIANTKEDAAYITRYVVEYATDAKYSDVQCVETEGSECSASLVNLYKGTTYYVRITAYAGDVNMGSAEGTFTTSADGVRIMTIDGLSNVRDIGGYSTNEGTTSQNKVYFGPAVDELSEAAEQYLSETIGVALEMDLRNPLEAYHAMDSTITSALKRYYPISETDVDANNAVYTEYFAQIFSALSHESNYPVYIHCDGSDVRADIVEDMIQALLGVEEANELTTVLASYTGDTLAQKVEAYLLAIGVTTTEIANVKSILYGEIPTEVTQAQMADSSSTLYGTNKGVSYSHGYLNSDTYKYWEAKAVAITTGKVSTLSRDKANKTATMDDNGVTVGFNDVNGTVSENYDIMYVYTMPCDATIQVTLNAQITGTSSDGIIAYAYINNTANCILSPTVVTTTNLADLTGGKQTITLNAGDKLYYRMNKNGNATEDTGSFRATITFKEITQSTELTQGEAYHIKTWEDMTSSGTAATAIYGHAKATEWSFASINLETGETEAMIQDGDYMYVQGDSAKSAKLGYSTIKARTSETHDLLHVYTMPCKAKVTVQFTLEDLASGSDGVSVCSYVNDTSNCAINRTVCTADTAPVSSGMVLNAGDKIYFRLTEYGELETEDFTYYVRITFQATEPTGNYFRGEPYEVASVEEMMASGKDSQSYSHGSLIEPELYPYWDTASIAVDGTEKPLVKSTNDTGTAVLMRAEGDSSSLLRSDGYSYPAANSDLAYIYTMPCTATVDVTITASIQEYQDGTIVYCYVNDRLNCIINRKHIKDSERSSWTIADVTLNVGDKIYFCLNNNGTVNGDTGYFYGRITYKGEPGDNQVYGTAYGAPTCTEMAVKGPSYSHGSITEPDKYPYWSQVSIATDEAGNETETPLIICESLQKAYVKTDGSAYLSAASTPLAQTSEEHDFAYVYTMPCKAQINLVLTADIPDSNTGSDGVVVSAYINDASRGVFRTCLKYDSSITKLTANSITLDEGDKLYIRLGKNGNATQDQVKFYARIDYVGQLDEQAYQGNAFGQDVTWAEMVSGYDVNGTQVTSNGSLYSTGAVKATSIYRTGWATNAIDLSNGAEAAMTLSGDYRYVDTDDSSAGYLKSDGTALTGENHDLVYVYTMPCDADIQVTLTAEVTGTTGDGVVVSSYVDDISNFLINSTHVAAGTSLPGNTSSITLAKGQKLYFRLNKNSTTTGDTVRFYAKLTFLNSIPSGDTYDQAAQRTVVVSDMALGGVAAVNLAALDENATDLTIAENALWKWTPSVSKGWSVTASDLTEKGINDVKVRWSEYHQKQVILVTASANWAGIVDYATGTCIKEWTGTEIAAQPHAMEMLPNGDVVIAVTGQDTETTSESDLAGKLYYFHIGSNGTYTETGTVDFPSAHDVLWDEEENILWALGLYELAAYSITSSNTFSKVSGTGLDLETLGNPAGHAMSADYNDPDMLWYTSKSNVLQYNKTTNERVTAYAYSATMVNDESKLVTTGGVKGITSFRDGAIAFCIGDGSSSLKDSETNEAIAYLSNKIYVIDGTGQKTYAFSDLGVYRVCNLTTSYQ